MKIASTPLTRFEHLLGVTNLYVKDESANRTGTFKDRLSSCFVDLFVNSQLSSRGTTLVASISYGNTALSLAHYTARINSGHAADLVCAAFVPTWMRERTLGPDSFGTYSSGDKIFSRLKRAHCEVIEIRLDEKLYSSNDLRELAHARGLNFENFVDVTEGLSVPTYETIASEALEKQHCPLPDYAIVPFGAGVLANELHDYFARIGSRTKVIAVSSGNPDTIAIMLYSPVWLDTEELISKGRTLTQSSQPDRKGITREPYFVHHVRDEEIEQVLQVLGRSGISSEPSAAAAFAILPRLQEIHPEFDPLKSTVLVVNSGNGIASLASDSPDSSRETIERLQ